MISAASFDRHATDKTTNAIAGVDLSSWLSWICYGLGFVLALKLSPSMADDLTSAGFGLTVIVAAIALFFGLILIIQHHMNVSLRNTSFGAPKQLMTDGFFAVSRNPMYVAFLLPLISLTYYSPLAGLSAAALYVVSMNGLVIAVEETVLDANFGSQFRRYCLATPRWLVW
jgi:protein-S-isoprenylcysteine O-methyltransferase Ste14